MSEGKKDDFWNSSSEDDFWKKPVAGEEWLKKDESFQNPYLRESTNPYYQSHVHEDAEWVSSQEIQQELEEKEEKKRAFFTPRKIISLIFFGAMVAVMLLCVVVVKTVGKKLEREARNVNYETEEITENSVWMYDNTTVFLEDDCITVVTKETFPSFYEDYQIIMLLMSTKSDGYQSYSYPLKYIYISYDENGSTIYKEPLDDYYCEAYLGHLRLKSLYRYVYDGDAFAFFVVPKSTEHVTLYIEQRERTMDAGKIEKVFTQEKTIRPFDEEKIKFYSSKIQGGDYE